MSREERIRRRSIASGNYIVDTKCTIRECARVFGVCKSTTHNDVSERLIKIDYKLYLKVREILDHNKEERGVRGGRALKERYNKKRTPYPVSLSGKWIGSQFNP